MTPLIGSPQGAEWLVILLIVGGLLAVFFGAIYAVVRAGSRRP